MFLFLLLTVLLGVAAIFLVYKALSCKCLQLKGRHVLVTGGSSGIGLAFAWKAAAKGANVTILARNEKRLKEAKELVESKRLDKSQSVHVSSVDVSGSVDTIKQALAEAETSVGPVDIVVNCVGAATCGTFLELTEDVFMKQMKVNYFSAVNATKAVLPSMVSRRRGHVLFLSSQGGQIGIYGYAAYAPTKYALRGLAETLQMEVKAYGVNVSIVFPPDTDTPGFAEESKSKSEITKQLSQTSGVCSPEDMADCIVHGIECGRHSIWIGVEGFYLSCLTAGMAPVLSLFEALPQVLGASICRLVALVYLRSFDGIVKRGVDRLKSQKAE